MTREQIEALGIAWPGNHPQTGEPFVSATVSTDMNVQTVYYQPPLPPEREVVTEWDDDGPIAWRTLTDEEFEAAQVAYEKAAAEWKRTRGTAHVAGARTTTGRFTCASGAWAEGQLAGKQWYWVETKW